MLILNILDRKIKRQFVKTQEKAGNKKEKEVMETLTSFVAAINARDLELMRSFFSSEAALDSITEKKTMNKDAYLETSKSLITQLECFLLDDVIFLPGSENAFRLVGTAKFFLRNKTFSKGIILSFVKERQWRIVRLAYE